jgi:hypothetical protein
VVHCPCSKYAKQGTFKILCAGAKRCLEKGRRTITQKFQLPASVDLMMSESPGSVIVKTPTRYNLPQAVPRSTLSAPTWTGVSGNGLNALAQKISHVLWSDVTASKQHKWKIKYLHNAAHRLWVADLYGNGLALSSLYTSQNVSRQGSAIGSTHIDACSRPHDVCSALYALRCGAKVQCMVHIQ